MADKTFNIEKDPTGKVTKIGNTALNDEQFKYLNENIEGFGEILKKGYLTSKEYNEVLEKIVKRLNDWSNSLEGLVSQVNNVLNDLTEGGRARSLARASVNKFTGVLNTLSANLVSGEIMTQKQYFNARQKLTQAIQQAAGVVSTMAARDARLDKYKNSKLGEEALRRKLINEEKIDAKDASAFASARTVLNSQKKSKDALESEYNLSKTAQRNSGTAAVSAIGDILGKLGLGGVGSAFGEYTRKIQEAYKSAESAKAGSGAAAARQAKKDNLRELLISLRGLGAAALWAKIIQNFLAVNKAATDVKRSIGEWSVQLSSAHFGLATTKETLETIGSLVKQTGLNVTHIFTGEELGRIAEAQKLYGMTADQANALGIYSKLNNQSLDKYTDNLFAGLKAGVAATKSAVAMGEAQKVAASASNAIKISMGGAANKIGEAAVVAASLGMSLEDIQNISKNLMQFESSIESEMQAQLLTGRSLNLAKARELALNNDLAGVGKEIARQGVTMQEYGQMNYIQQENLAKALGMSREQMANMLVVQALANHQSADAVAKTMRMSKEQVKALDTQRKIQDVITRIADIFAPILQAIVGVLDPILSAVAFVANIFNKMPGWLKGILLGTLLVMRALHTWNIHLGIGKGLLAGFGKLLSGLGDTAKNVGVRLASVFNKDLRGVHTSHGRWYKKGTRGAIKNPFTGGVANSTADVGKTTNKAVEGANGFGKINMSSVLKGAAAMLIMAGALWVLAKACQELESVTWESLGKAGAALLGLTLVMMLVGQISKAFGAEMMLGVAVLAMLGLVVYALTDPITRLVAALNEGDGVMNKLLGLAAGLAVLGPALMLFGLSMALGGFLAIPVLITLASVFKSLSNANFSAVAAGIRTVAGSVKELSSSLSGLSTGKLLALALLGGSRITGIRGEGEGISANVSSQGTITESASSGETTSTTNLSRIEQKLDMINRTIIQSRPDWNWLEFNGQQQLNNTHGLVYSR